MIRPVLTISFCSIIPVEAAMAFGGVEIGSTIPSDDPIATPTRRVVTPPRGARLAETAALAPTAARIGRRTVATEKLSELTPETVFQRLLAQQEIPEEEQNELLNAFRLAEETLWIAEREEKAE